MRTLLCLCLCQKPGGLSDIILPRTIHYRPKNVPVVLCLATPAGLEPAVGADQLPGKRVKVSDPAWPQDDDPEDESRQMCSRSAH